MPGYKSSVIINPGIYFNSYKSQLVIAIDTLYEVQSRYNKLFSSSFQFMPVTNQSFGINLSKSNLNYSIINLIIPIPINITSIQVYIYIPGIKVSSYSKFSILIDLNL